LKSVWLCIALSIAILGIGLFIAIDEASAIEKKPANLLIASAKINDLEFSPLYHSNSGKVTNIKTLATAPFHKTEVSFTENGTINGIGDVTNKGTFEETFKTDKIINGKGKGVIVTNDGQIAEWTSNDVGKINHDRSERYQGVIFFSVFSNGKLTFLNNTVGLYTTNVGSNGSSLRQIWQWK
jgi:hypothetical protein